MQPVIINKHRRKQAGSRSACCAEWGENMAALDRELNLTEIGAKPQASSRTPKAKFRVYGEEMIEKEVKPSGNTGRVYLPPDWVGKHVKIIRID